MTDFLVRFPDLHGEREGTTHTEERCGPPQLDAMDEERRGPLRGEKDKNPNKKYKMAKIKLEPCLRGMEAPEASAARN